MLYSSYSVVILVVSVIFPVLASIAIGLRFRSRKIKSLALKADDFTILSALVSVLFYWSDLTSYSIKTDHYIWLSDTKHIWICRRWFW